ncbi:glucose-6-phosphate isomerase [Actinomadura sp. WMMB 499]|uniref:glucose-6-phosphate isomerase n=1 Tax=Actinomadura sp. WMMB 499 TaxID=1219491 RepID=UPI001246FDC0|nr:glucose-6-phosphate isomerase [Actinomadura sp. WMMB 499]QFG19988.1 glucose-6-phosphate isomerase [Actinomadura sp. WMMB 499]
MNHSSVAAGSIAVTARKPLKDAAERVLGRLWIDRVPARLAAGDPTLWPSAAAAEAEGRRLCAPARPGPGRDVPERVAELRRSLFEDAAGLAAPSRIVLIGQGAVVRAAEAIVRTAGADAPDGQGDQDERGAPAAPPAVLPLTVLDGPEPGPLARLAADPAGLAGTVAVVAGDDPGTDTLRRVLLDLMRDAGVPPEDAGRRFVVVAAPDSAAAKAAAEAGHPLVEAPAQTAFGALSPYALVPAALAGADVAALLEAAAAELPALARPEDNPGLVLGAILGGAVRAGRGTLVLGGYPAALPGLDGWAARLLDEATGGRLGTVVQGGGLPVAPDPDLFLVTLDGRPHQDDATVTGPLAAQLVVWEYAAAVAAHLLGRDPLAPPPRQAPLTLDDGTGDPVFSDGPPGRAVEVHTTVHPLAGATDLEGLLEGLATLVGPRERLALVAYLDPDGTLGEGAAVRRLAALLAARCERPVTVAWGARGPVPGAVPPDDGTGNDQRDRGVYLLVTGNAVRDVPVPDRHHRLGMLQLARALGDARAVREDGRPVVRLHLQDRRAGLARLLDAARGEG